MNGIVTKRVDPASHLTLRWVPGLDAEGWDGRGVMGDHRNHDHDP